MTSTRDCRTKLEVRDHATRLFFHANGPMSSHKARAPAHQNTTAWKHNPNSRKTKKVGETAAQRAENAASSRSSAQHRAACFVAAVQILSLPNVGLCKRCHDIIEWRKRYRKVRREQARPPAHAVAVGAPFTASPCLPLQYKPLTKPAKCVGCHKPAVKAAYHAMCSDCSREKNVCPKCLESKEIWGACGCSSCGGDGAPAGGAFVRPALGCAHLAVRWFVSNWLQARRKRSWAP